MNDLRHWQPVLPVRALRRKPVAIRVGEQELVLFRNQRGAIGALTDRCPHRGMRLSTGWVEGERLVCPYHGWSYDPAGEGCSPSSERMRVCATAFEVATGHDMIWVKEQGVSDELPRFAFPGLHLVHVLHRVAPVPLELLVDNFIEIEHTCTGHWLFGFDRADMAKVELNTTTTHEGIHVVCSGPQKRIPWLAEKAIGVRSGDRFVADFTIHLEPIRTVYNFTYTDPRSGKLRDTRAAEVAYFSRISDQESRLVAFYFSNLSPAGLNGLFVMPLFRRWIDYEYELDQRLLSNIADRRTDLQGFRLGRFDKPLVEFRRALKGGSVREISHAAEEAQPARVGTH